ncbi:MAG: FAD/NAD(P)-binding oxidoreductase [Polyangiales bacterium]
MTETCQVLVVGTSVGAQAAQEYLQRKGLRAQVRSVVALGERVGVLTSPAATLAPRVVAVDPVGRTATLSNGTRLRWGALILAPAPGGVSDVRGEVDAVGSVEEARAVMAIRRRPRRVAVLGDGLTAWEIAAAVRARGPATTLITGRAARLRDLVGASAASLLEETHRANGITLLDGAAPAPSTARASCSTTGARCPRRPRRARRPGRHALSQRRARRGRARSARGRRRQARAARGSSRWAMSRGGAIRVTGRLLHLDHAAGQRRQGEIAADAALGGTDRLDAVPFRRSRHFDLALTLLGAPCPDDAAEQAGDPSRGGETITWRGADGVTAVLTITRDEAQRRSA